MSKKNFEEIVLDKLSNIENRVWNIETDVSGLKTDVSELKRNVKNLDSKVTIIEQRSIMTDRKLDWLFDKMEVLEWAVELNRKYINQSFSNIPIST